MTSRRAGGVALAGVALAGESSDMERAVYAVFDSQRVALSAVHALLRQGLPNAVLGMQLHSEVLEVEDLPAAATLARRWATLACLACAGVGAVLGTFGFDPSGMLFGAVAGGLVGTLVAGSSGRRTPKPEVGRLRREIERGRTIVTMDVTHPDAGIACEHFLAGHGALRVGMT
jgi:hypothetical protein